MERYLQMIAVDGHKTVNSGKPADIEEVDHMFCSRFTTRLTWMVGVSAVLLVASLFSVPGAVAQTGTITVSGRGVIKISPDMATIRFGVVTDNELPDQARALNALAAAEAMNAVRAMGVNEEHIQLASLRLTPKREYDPDRRIYIESGFEASRDVIVKVMNLDILPDLVATIISKGANRIDNIQYGLDNRDQVELQAYAKAAHRAREKASVIATTLGSSVGSVVQINERGVSVPQPVVMRMEAAMDIASAGKVVQADAFAGGEIEVSASVTVVFTLVTDN